jgi:hypothetical protein
VFSALIGRDFLYQGETYELLSLRALSELYAAREGVWRSHRDRVRRVRGRLELTCRVTTSSSYCSPRGSERPSNIQALVSHMPRDEERPGEALDHPGLQRPTESLQQRDVQGLPPVAPRSPRSTPRCHARDEAGPGVDVIRCRFSALTRQEGGLLRLLAPRRHPAAEGELGDYNYITDCC